MDWQNLLKYKKQALIFSALVIFIALFGFVYRGGFLYGIEFTGGFQVMLEYTRPLDTEHVGEIREHFGIMGTEVQVNTFEIGGQSRGLMLTARGQQVVNNLTERLYSAGRAGNQDIFKELGEEEDEYIVPEQVLKDNFSFSPEQEQIDIASDDQATIRNRVENLVNEYVLQGITGQLGGLYEDKNIIDLNKAGFSQIQQWLVEIQTAGFVRQFEALLEEEKLKEPEDIKPLLEKFDIPEERFWQIFSMDAADARLDLTTEVTVQDFENIVYEEFFGGRYETTAERIIQRRDSMGLFRSSSHVLRLSVIEQLPRPIREDSFYLSPFVVMSSEMISPAIGADLIGQAVMAIFVSLFGILAYLYIRFELTYSLGAIAAILHDLILTAGLITLFGVQFDVPVVAAILTVIGYSLNDTIVNFDRVRENKTLMGYKANWYEVINRSVYEVLNRTIVTSLTTFIAVLFLYLYGGVALNNFAFTLLIGVIAGTYSSIFISNVVLLKLQNTLRTT